MKLYPIMVNMNGKPVVIIGGAEHAIPHGGKIGHLWLPCWDAMARTMPRDRAAGKLGTEWRDAICRSPGPEI